MTVGFTHFSSQALYRLKKLQGKLPGVGTPHQGGLAEADVRIVCMQARLGARRALVGELARKFINDPSVTAIRYWRFFVVLPNVGL